MPKPPPMPSPGTDPKPPAIEVGKELDAYGNVIPADCKTWYDGCNTCRANREMPCADSAQPGGASEAILECPVKNWCVCEWAFKDYIAAAGGCDAIKSIDCNATNGLAIAHYEAKGTEAALAALACLEKRCGLDAKTVDEAYDAFDNKEPWDEVLS